MIIKILFIAFWAGIAGVDLFNGLTHIHRPLVTGLVIGIILGDIQTGIITGATLELVWLGMIPLGGAQPPNTPIGGILGVTFAILSNQEPAVAVSVAIVFALFTGKLIPLVFKIYARLMKKADICAAEGNLKGIKSIRDLGMIILFNFYFVIALVAVALINIFVIPTFDLLPLWLIEGLGVAGKMMPAVGFAMLLKVMLKKEYASFFVLGFVIVAYMKLDILPLTVLAVAMVAYDYYLSKNKGEKPEKLMKREVPSDGI